MLRHGKSFLARSCEAKLGFTQFFRLLKQFGIPTKNIGMLERIGATGRAAVRYFPDTEYTLVESQDHLNVADLLRGSSGGCNEVGVLPLYVPTKDQSSTFLQYSRIENDAV
jgi:hypothetical protein